MKYRLLKLPLILSLFILLSFTVAGCGGSEQESSAEQEPVAEQENEDYLDEFKDTLTPFQLEHGIGPITELLEIEEAIDEEMVARGREIFTAKCEVCHAMQGDKVGPSLGDVVERRSPEFVINFILNPGENVLNHPVGLDLLEEHNTEMPYSDITMEEARAIYEYLRDNYSNM
jgi:mono/diheme cytochrome c family protein